MPRYSVLILILIFAIISPTISNDCLSIFSLSFYHTFLEATEQQSQQYIEQQQQLYQTTTTCILLTQKLITLSFDKITAIIQNNENQQSEKIIQKIQGNALLDCIKSFNMSDVEKLVQKQKEQENITIEDILVFFPKFNLEQFDTKDANFTLTDQETRVLYVQMKLEEMMNQSQIPQKQTLMQFIFSSKLNIFVIAFLAILIFGILFRSLQLRQQNQRLLQLAKIAEEKNKANNKPIPEKKKDTKSEEISEKSKKSKKND